jgi:hypothetical protein
MFQFGVKVAVSALVIAGVSELAKRSATAGAVLASLPITSMLAMIWLFYETGDSGKVADLSRGIFWAVIPSLLFFAMLPFLVGKGLRFEWAMLASSLVMLLGYSGWIWITR